MRRILVELVLQSVRRLAFVGGLVAAGAGTAAAQSAVPVALGTLGGPSSEAVSINNVGQVVGWSITAEGAEHAFLWSAGGGMVDLGTLGGTSSRASGINDSGQVVGWSSRADGATHAFVWTRSDGMVDVGALDGWVSIYVPYPPYVLSFYCGSGNSMATGINNAGQVVGSGFYWQGPVMHLAYCLPSWPKNYTFLRSGASGMVEIPMQTAAAINDAGQVVGSAGATGSAHATLRDVSGSMEDLGTLGGPSSFASAINSAGQVVGQSDAAETMIDGSGSVQHIARAFLWTAARGMVDLGTLGGTFSEASGINAVGHVIGWSDVSGPSAGVSNPLVRHAFRWTPSGGMVDLGTLGGTASVARSINDVGQVVGWSTTASGARRAVIWWPSHPVRRGVDVDGDRRSDISVFRPSDGTWYTLGSSGTATAVQWGNGLDTLVPGDYDGDGKSDVAVFRRTNGTWYIVPSALGSPLAVQWGNGSDTPVVGDYDGDGRADVAVFRPSSGTWYILQSGDGAGRSAQWGNVDDWPEPADYDGDGRTDIAVFRPESGTWYIRRSSGGSMTVQWGNRADVTVPADYDGDGKADVAVFRPSNGTWYILLSSGGATAVQWGNGLDRPVPADYDGDAKADVAVFRPANGTWYIVSSRTGIAVGMQWGNELDVP